MKKMLIYKLLIFFILPVLGVDEEQLLQEANNYYQQGEYATSYDERKNAFNQALWRYHLLEQDTLSADFNQILGNTYFQLGEYAWAVLYYERALKDQSNPNVLSYLNLAQKKLGITPSSQPKWNQIFLQILKPFSFLFWIFVLLFFIFSSAIWFSFSWKHKLVLGSTIFSLFILIGISWLYYSSPLEGIIIKTTSFYRLPAQSQLELTISPLLAGTKVYILQVTQDSNWLKVANAEGTSGYIPLTHLRPL